MKELVAIKKISKEFIIKYISLLMVVVVMLLQSVYLELNRFVVTIDDGFSLVELNCYESISVGELFARENIDLSTKDTINIPLSTKLNSDTTISILRGGQDNLPIMPSLEIGKLISTAGYEQYTIIRAREEREAKYIRDQQKTSSYHYTGYVGGNYTFNDDGTISTSVGTYELVETLTVNASAYCPCVICCEEYANGYTADGSKATAGYTIATPSIYPFGTLFYIPFFDRVFEVEDRGGAIQGNRIDIYFDTHNEALQFGRRTITIYRVK